MRLRSAVLACAIASLSTRALAAQWYTKFGIKQTTDTKVVPRPALFQLSKAVGDTLRATVNAAVTYSALEGPLYEFSPFVEYQRVPDKTSPQDVLKGGISGEWQAFDIVSARPASPILTTQLAYKGDRVKHTESVQAAVSVTGIFRSCERHVDPDDPKIYWSDLSPQCVLRPDVRTDSRALAFRYLPYLGFEGEAPLDTNRASELTKRNTRSVARATFAMQTQFYPAPKLLDYRLQLTADYSYRRSSSAETSRAVRDHNRFDAGATFLLLKTQPGESSKRSAGVSLVYTTGSDPSNGLERIEMTKLGFTIMY